MRGLRSALSRTVGLSKASIAMHDEIHKYTADIINMKNNSFPQPTIDVATEVLNRLLEKAEH